MITEFRIGTTHTINLGNFESTRIEASVTYAVPDSVDDLAALKAQAQQELRSLFNPAIDCR